MIPLSARLNHINPTTPRYLLSAASNHICNISICKFNCHITSSSLHSRLLTFETITDYGSSAKILIDCGSTTNFISRSFVNKHTIPAATTHNATIVKLADGTVHNTCKLVTSFPLYINDRRLNENLLVFPIDTFDIILGMPFLKKYNPHIDWVTETINIPPSPLLKLVKQQQLTNKNNTLIIPPIQLCSMKSREIRRALKKNESVFLLHVRPVKPGLSGKSDRTDRTVDRTDRTKDRTDRTEFEKLVSDSVYNENDIKDVNIQQLNSINTQIDPSLAKVLQDYSDVFPEDLPKGLPPRRPIEHKINLVPGATPTFKNHYRLSPQDLDELKVHLNDLLDHGFIRAAHSPYGAPVLFAKKAGDVKRRLCIDYRDLNRITVKDKYPIPRVDELLDRLHGAKYFTKLDLRSGYHQVRLAEDDIQKSAFNTRYGQYEFLVLPFGMTGAPSTFMHLMNSILDPYLDKFVVAYLDDILIYSRTKEEHEIHVRAILEALRENKLYCKESKCEFFRREVTFLGFIVGADGLKVDPAKVEAVKSWPIPKSITDCRSFLGFVGFYRKFIDNHSAIVTPISELTKIAEQKKFVWTAAAQEAFEKMIAALCSAPVLILPDPTKPYVVNTDASGFAIGACLQQDQGKGLQPICYMSKKMLDAETRYPVHHKEMLAIVCALKEWRHYLHGNKFKVQVMTDHKSLVFFDTQPKLSERQARWNEYLADFDFEIIYQKGETNIVADALSRRADLDTGTAVADGDNVNVSIDTAELNAVDTESKDDEDIVPEIKSDINDIITDTATESKSNDIGDSAIDTANDHDIITQIRAGYQADEHCQQILKGIITSRVNHFTIKNGLIYYDNTRLVVPDILRLKTLLLHEYHDGKLAGHVGLDKTYFSLCKSYYWFSIYTDTKQYCRTCLVCQQTKASNRKKAGLLQPLPIPAYRWHTITMDFIVQLPKSTGGYDAIFVVVDKLSKRAYFIPTHTTATAPTTALLFFKHVIKNGHGIPEVIISDRDSKFTSMFWQSLWKLLDTKLAMSTAFHPQSDGQTERTNRTLEQMLRAYTDVNQSNWDELLAYAEIAYNNSKNDSTGFSPFYLNHGQDMRLPAGAINSVNTPNAAVGDLLSELQSTMVLVQKNLVHAQEVQKKYADQHRREETFAIGDKVLVDARDINFTSGSKKLLDKYIGPYTIVALVGPVAYRIELPKKFRIHDVFHVSKLKRYEQTEKFPDRQQDIRPVADSQVDGTDAFVVEKLVDKKVVGKGKNAKVHYLVKWFGYPDWESSWEPIDHLTGIADESISAYEKSHNGN